MVLLVGLISVAALTLGFNLLLRASLEGDADRVLQARSAAALQGVEVFNGRVRASEAPDEAAPDSGVWIYDGATSIERPAAPDEINALADSMVARGALYGESKSEDLKLHAVPVSDGGRRLGSVVVALSIEPYERSANRALAASIILALVMLGLIVVLTRFALDRALRPVARLTAEASKRSEHDVDHRFDLGPPTDELTQLAATFDSMLARLAANLRHERLLTAEISHELRTPLSAISAEAELALSRPRQTDEYRSALETIQRRSGQLADILETLLLTARAEGGIRSEPTDANRIAEEALAPLRQRADRAKTIGLIPSAFPLLADVSLATGGRILAPLLENAMRYGHGKVAVKVERDGHEALFSVTDDGSGFTADEVELVFEPGRRGSAGVTSDSEGVGLGLALARRLARVVGGDVEAATDCGFGLIRVRLPLAES